MSSNDEQPILPSQRVQRYFAEPRPLQDREREALLRKLAAERNDTVGAYNTEEVKIGALISMKYLLDALHADDLARPQIAEYSRFLDYYASSIEGFDAQYEQRLKRDARLIQAELTKDDVTGADLVLDGFGAFYLQQNLQQVLEKGRPQTHDETYLLVHLENIEAYRIDMNAARTQSADIFPGIPIGSILAYDLTNQGIELNRRRTSVLSETNLGAADLRTLEHLAVDLTERDTATKIYLSDLYSALDKALSEGIDGD